MLYPLENFVDFLKLYFAFVDIRNGIEHEFAQVQEIDTETVGKPQTVGGVHYHYRAGQDATKKRRSGKGKGGDSSGGGGGGGGEGAMDHERGTGDTEDTEPEEAACSPSPAQSDIYTPSTFEVVTRDGKTVSHVSMEAPTPQKPALGLGFGGEGPYVTEDRLTPLEMGFVGMEDMRREWS